MSLLWIVRSHQLVLLLVLQVITSLFFIYKGKTKLSYTTEIILMIIFMYYNRFDFSIKQLICYFTEYILMKMLLLIIVFVAKEFAFYVIVSVTHKNSGGYKLFKNKKKFIKFEAHIWNKIKYGIRLKKGIPAMVNKKHKLTGVSFDKDGFPKFKAVVTVNLDRKLWKKERDIHFYHASRILYEKISKNKANVNLLYYTNKYFVISIFSLSENISSIFLFLINSSFFAFVSFFIAYSNLEAKDLFSVCHTASNFLAL